MIRVFFSGRDAQNRSHLASVDFTLRESVVQRITAPSEPLLGPGPRGAFDDSGVTATSLVRDGDRLLAFYLGWSLGRTVPFTNFIGVAIGDRDGTHFEKPFLAPIVGRSEANPFSLGYPWVLRIGHGWRMWFGSHLAWGADELEMTHVIKTAASVDAMTWRPSEAIAVPLNASSDPEEYAVSRPVVLAEGQGYSMWYCRRHARYRLGYAVSLDGEHWRRRDDEVILEGAAGAWEGSEVAYPCVFDHGGRRYMLYNGSGYGRSGFGIALLD